MPYPSDLLWGSQTQCGHIALPGLHSRVSLTHSNLAQSRWRPGSLLVVKIYLLSLSSFEHYGLVKAKEIISPIFANGKQRQSIGCKNTLFSEEHAVHGFSGLSKELHKEPT